VKDYTAYVLDTEKYRAQPLFNMQASSPEEVLAIARERLAKKGLKVEAPYCIDVRLTGDKPVNMRKRYLRIYGDPRKHAFVRRVQACGV
jgi:hypothetical protein